MRTLNCLSDLKKLLELKGVNIDFFNGFKLIAKNTTFSYVSVFDRWNIYKGQDHKSYKTQELLKHIDNIIEEL